MRTLKISLLVFILSITISAQNFWQQTNGPYGGATVNDFLAYNDSTIFLGTNEGIIRSTNNGVTWNKINGQYLDTQIKCLAQDKVGNLYAGSRNSFNLQLLLKSIDQGNSWNYLSFGYSTEVKTIFIPYKDTIMLGSLDMGVIRKFDGGTIWNRVNNGNSYSSIHEIIQLDDGSVLAGSDGGGVFKTTNWGDLWIASNSGIVPNPNGYIYAESFYETSPGNIFVGTGMGIYFSSDYGNNWIYKSNGLTNYRTAQCIEKDASGILYAGIDLGNGVYYSTNGGDYWYHLGLNFTINTLGWDFNSNLYAGGSGLYLYNFEDSTWIQVYNQSYIPVEVGYLYISKNGSLLATTQYLGLQYTSNSGESWRRTNYQGYGPNDIVTIDDSIFIVGDRDHVYVSRDTGYTWDITGDFSVWSLYFDEINKSVYMGTHRYDPGEICGIYKSVNLGESWELVHEFPILAVSQGVDNIHFIDQSNIFLASVYYTDPPPAYSRYGHLYKSTDNLQNWEEIFSEQSNYVVQTIIEVDSNIIYVLREGNLLISQDQGVTWTTLTLPGSNTLVSDHSGRIYRDAGIGVRYSTDEGVSWFLVSNSGLNNWVNDIVINQNNRIYLATTSGIYFGEADSIVVSIEKNVQLALFHLSQNYPNPFNPTTSMQYTIGSRQFITLKVYDILGREIATLINEEKPAGEYEVEFNAANLPSGIYFYQLKAGQYSETKKMVLLR